MRTPTQQRDPIIKVVQMGTDYRYDQPRDIRACIGCLDNPRTKEEMSGFRCLRRGEVAH